MVIMEFSQENVQRIIFGQHEQQKNLEAVIMRQSDIDLVITLDEIAALPDRSDRAVALQMMFKQMEGK